MARKRKKGLGERHKRILEVLKSYADKQGYPPSIREICQKANISSTSVVNYYLDQLEEMGYIERDRHVSRGVRLIQTADGFLESATGKVRNATDNIKKSFSNLMQIPIVGRIVASAPVPVPQSDFSYYDSESMVEIARSMLNDKGTDPAELFALEVQGDSMIDAMVNDGDIVVMKNSQQARNGEMVAIWLSDKDETTLKYFYLENGRVRLQPANPTMKPIYIDDPSTVKIQGKVVMIIRQVGQTK